MPSIGNRVWLAFFWLPGITFERVRSGVLTFGPSLQLLITQVSCEEAHLWATRIILEAHSDLKL
jgi:hypothetical protein